MINITKTKQKTIPVFFASDSNYMPYLTVAFKSLVDNANNHDKYMVYVLTNDLTAEDLAILKKYEKRNVKIYAVDVNDKIESIKDKVALRDYYSVSIYFRLFIPTLFPQYKKAIYLDSDIVINRDIADLYSNDIGDNYLGAVLDEVIWSSKDFTYYAENALGVTNKQYFNSGVLIMNLDKFRDNDIENDFYRWVNNSNWGAVAPDQDYLNVTCKNKVKYLNPGWNKMPMGNRFEDKNLYLIHYNMFMKPWKYQDTMFGEYFWYYACKTEYYGMLKQKQLSYTEEEKQADANGYTNLVKLAVNIANSKTNYWQSVLAEQLKQQAEAEKMLDLDLGVDFENVDNFARAKNKKN